jgi:hypothetical protein
MEILQKGKKKLMPQPFSYQGVWREGVGGWVFFYKNILMP